MQFKFFTVLALAATAFAAPVTVEKRSARTFAQLTISGGVGGNALAEAKAKFPAGNLSATQVQDFNTEAHCAVLAESAFVAAGKSSAISVGLTKNKVLKIWGTIVALQGQIQKSGGKASSSQTAHLNELQTKLGVNVAIDQKNAGKASKTVSFNC
ncbi:unnamed protein product [Mycena citricolor]|uniref:Small secreted protein n=1 Tax=Mycena citricolor TaxID=2018698 RepID=A0AAD2HQF0_9AGAR|nr:unnamed protein product [Mycena citricolor]CAK5279765.1 unnamed protein product [Mycena citricolor]